MIRGRLFISNFKNLIKIIVFTLCIIYSLIFVGDYYKTLASKNKINTFNIKRFEEFYSAKNLDMIFLGSSHSYCTFDPDVFDKILNLKSFQMGMPLQHPDGSYITLLEVLKYQKPKYIVVEVYFDMLNDNFNLKQVDTLFQVLENKQLEHKFVKEVFPFNEKIKYKLDVARFNSDFLYYLNNQLNIYLKQNDLLKDDMSLNKVGKYFYRDKGFLVCEHIISDMEATKKNRYNDFDGKTYEISDVQKKYLKLIKKVCDDNNIELFFVTAPLPNVSFEKIKNYDVVYNKIKDFSDEIGVNYLDYNIINSKSKMLKYNDFMDDDHVNYNGALIISENYAKFLRDKIKKNKEGIYFGN